MDDCKNNMVSGLVSVIIPTYKRPNMLGRAIDSVLEQSYSNIELMIILMVINIAWKQSNIWKGMLMILELNI